MWDSSLCLCALGSMSGPKERRVLSTSADTRTQRRTCVSFPLSASCTGELAPLQSSQPLGSIRQGLGVSSAAGDAR